MTISIFIGLGVTSGPTISGNTTVGSTLTLAPIQLSGTSPITYSVQWLRDGTAISGATRPGYTTVSADLGKAVSLRLTLPDGTTQTSNVINVVAEAAAATAPSLAYAAISVSAGTAVTANAIVSGTTPITFAKVSGPSWLSVNASTGQLTGTAPGAAETGTLVVSATNSAGSVQASVAVTVTAADTGAYVITLTAATRDAIVYDSGFARGLDSAWVPLSGTTDAPDGTAIMAEIVTTDGTTVVHASQQIATASGGAFSGGYTGATRSNAFRKARVWAGSGSKVMTATKFGVGHRIDIWGQSEIQLLTEPYYNGTGTPRTVSDSEAVTIIFNDFAGTYATAGNVFARHVTSAEDNTRFAAIANALITARPGEKFDITLQTRSGTHLGALVSDATGLGNGDNRLWSDDKALHDYTTNGGKTGLIAFDWYAAPRDMTTSYGQNFHKAIFGQAIDGTAVAVGTSWTGGSATYQFDHFLTEFYDFAHTKVAVLEPHRFEVTSVRDNTINIAACRTAVRSMMANSAYAASGTMVYGHPVMLYRTDDEPNYAHPQPGDSGSVRFGVGLINSAIRAMGLTSWVYPVIDSTVWASDGSYVDFVSSAGPIIALDSSIGIAGPVINSVSVKGALVNGKIRVTAAAAGLSAFTSSTLAQFAPNSTGLVTGDEYREYWDSFPGVDVGAPGVEYVPLAPAPNAAVMASTIAGEQPWVIAGQNDAIQIASSKYSGLSQKLAWEIDAAMDAGTASRALLTFNNGSTTIQTLNSNGYIFRVGANGSTGQLTAAGTWKPGVRQKIKLVVDQTTGQWAFYVDGVELLNIAGNVTTSGAYAARLLANYTSGAWQGGVAGSVYGVKVWIGDATFSGSDPAAAPTYLLSGVLASLKAQANTYNASADSVAIIENSTRVDNS